MTYKIAILVHSWFSWVTAKRLSQKIDPNGKKTLYIFSRQFKPNKKDAQDESKEVRFEKYEDECVSNIHNSIDLEKDIWA